MTRYRLSDRLLLVLVALPIAAFLVVGTVLSVIWVAASANTHPKGGDVQQAPSPMSGAVLSDSEADAQPRPTLSGGKQ